MTDPILRLHTNDLLSKWGFADGDLLDDALPDEVLTRRYTHPTLRRLVREFVAPLLDQRVWLVDVDTIHNPIRAERVDGVEVDWYAGEHPVMLTPEVVEVPMREVRRVLREVMASGGDDDD